MFENVAGGAGRYAQYWHDYFCASGKETNDLFMIATGDVYASSKGILFLSDYSSVYVASKILVKMVNALKLDGYNVVLHANSAVELHPYRKLNCIKVVNVNDYDVAHSWRLLPAFLRERKLKGFRNFCSKILIRYMEKRVCRLADQVLTNSLFTKRMVDASYKISSKMIYKSVDASFNFGVKTPQKLDFNSALFVGVDFARKGLWELLHAYTDHPGMCLTVVGLRADQLRKFQKMQKNGEFQNINFLGILNKEELVLAYKQHAVFIMPSHREALGISLLEAMHFGCLCIASCAGGIPEIITDGTNGLLCKPTAVDISRCLATLEGMDQVEKDSVIQAGKNTAKQFNTKRMLGEVAILYDTIVLRHHKL